MKFRLSNALPGATMPGKCLPGGLSKKNTARQMFAWLANQAWQAITHFFCFFSLGGLAPPPNEKNEKNKANANATYPTNF